MTYPIDSDTKSGLTLGVIWRGNNLIELECTLAYRGYRGVSKCYARPEDLTSFATALDHIAESSEGQASFDSGLQDGSRRIALRTYTVDLAGHIFVHVTMATDNHSQRPEGVWRIELEMKTESWAMSQFSKHLRSIVASRDDFAFLQAIG